MKLTNRLLTPRSPQGFDWLYRSNPFGPARAVLAINPDTGAVAGAAAAFPRRIYIPDGEAAGYVLGDFCLESSQRSLGPALQLQQALLAQISSSSNASFWYDFPSASMMAIYRRLGLASCPSIRYIKLLRCDYKLKRISRYGLLFRTASAVGNMLLRLTDRGAPPASHVELSLSGGRCGEEFTELARRVNARFGVCTMRTAEYLNWRYLAHPWQTYEILTARTSGQLLRGLTS